jgi:serine/threonine protein kinase
VTETGRAATTIGPLRLKTGYNGAVSITQLGRYQIQETLGRGAMGVVYLARDPIIDRRLALKTLRVDLDAEMTEEFRERFFREARAAGRLSHPGIVTIHDVGEDAESGLVYIAMEYIEGRDLKQLMAAGESPRPSEVTRIIAEVATALNYAHSMGVVHRDIKPANIILTSDGTAKITDFGVARLESSNLTVEGQFIGTPNFMAPEQISGGKVDGRSDLFSLGVVFYTLLTGQRPFAGATMHEVTLRIMQDTPALPTAVVQGLPAAFNPIILKCLQKDPDRRFQTGGELAQVLSALGRSLVHRDAGDTEQTAIHSPDLATHVTSGSEGLDLPDVFGEEPAPAMDDGPLPATEEAPEQDPGPPPPPPPPPKPERPRTSALRTRAAEKRTRTPLVRRLPLPEPVFWEVRPLWAWMIVIALVVGTAGTAALLSASVDHGPWPAPSDGSLAARAKVVTTLQAGHRALAAGDLVRAERLGLEALAQVPASPAARRLLTDVRRRLETEENILETREQVALLIEDARGDYRRGRYTSAEEKLTSALELDPGNELAASYLELTRDRRRAAAVSRASTARTAGGARVATPTPPDPRSTPRPTPTPGRSRITLYFNSPINTGRFEVLVNGASVADVPFDFTRKNMLGMKRGGTGVVQKVFTVPAGRNEVVVRLESPDLERVFERTFRQRMATGSDWSLRADLPRAGAEASFYLIPIRQ